MTFDKSFVLSQMAEDARKKFETSAGRVDRIDEILDRQMNGKTMGQMIGSTVGTAVWAGLYICLYTVVCSMVTNTVPALIALIASLVTAALMLVDHFVKLRYYGSISRTRSQLTQIRGRIESGRNGLSADLNAFLSSRGAGWNLALNPGSPIDEDLDDVERSISTMVALQSGSLPKLILFAYYVTGLAWAFTGSLAMEGLLYTLIGGEISQDAVAVITVIGAVIVTVAEYFIAKYLWSQTNCAVGNLTLFATLAGPILFCLLALAAGLIVAVVSLILSLLAGLLALVVGFSVLSAFCSGG